jgi:hypothetical protein
MLLEKIFSESIRTMSELFRNALSLNYLEKPSELEFWSAGSLGLSEPKAVLCQIQNCARHDLLAAHTV